MIVTPEKLRLRAPSAGARDGVDQQDAARTALGVPPEKACQAKATRTVRVERVVDMVRGLRVLGCRADVQ